MVRNGGPGHDRRGHAPDLVGLSFIVAWGAVRLVETQPVLRSAVAVAGVAGVAALAWAGWVQTSYWRDSTTLYRHALSVTERNYFIHKGLGNAFHREGREPEAAGQYRTALEIRPGWPPALIGLADTWLSQGQVDRALATYGRVLETDPGNDRARGARGLALLRTGRFEEGERELRRALDTHGGAAELHAGLGIAASGQGRPADAVRHYREALRHAPGLKEAANNLAWLLATCDEPSIRRPEEAVYWAERAASKGGPGAIDTLAAAYAATGRFEDAIRGLSRAEKRARELGQHDQARDFRERLELYREGKPFTEPCGAE